VSLPTTTSVLQAPQDFAVILANIVALLLRMVGKTVETGSQDHGTLHKPSVLEDRMAGRGMDRRADLFFSDLLW
jgi:hypothetical protein